MNKIPNGLTTLIIILSLSIIACTLTTQLSEPQLPTAAPPIVSPTQMPLPSVITDEDQVLIKLYEQINPAVVNIITYSTQANTLTPAGQGSGFVYDLKGNIVTNAHVVHGADEIEISFADGQTYPAELLGEDLHSDLAVIKIETLPNGVTPVPLGNIDEVAVGQTVVAIGNPFGLGGTLTRGIVSALGRTIPALTPFSIPQSIQTDAPINPGNSGGPLLNLKGEVIGVNAQIETNDGSRANSGVGFAIPVSIVERVIPELIENGEYTWAWLGVSGFSVTPAQAEEMDLDEAKGAYISEVLEDGPSQKAGVRGSSRQISSNGRQIEIGGDIIIALDGQPINNFTDLLSYITLYTTPGQEVTATVIRNGQYRELVITVEARPTSESIFPFPFP